MKGTNICSRIKINFTYSAAYRDEELAHRFGVVDHYCFNGSVQHLDFLRPLLLLVLQDILTEEGTGQKR